MVYAGGIPGIFVIAAGCVFTLEQPVLLSES